MKSVVAVVGDRIAGFELGILCQVFGLDRSDDGLPCYDFAVCGPRPGLVPTTSGFAVEVPSGLDRVVSADLVAIPAWPDLGAPLDPAIGAAIRAAHEAGATLLSICSGTFALAGAGVLDGRRATTHWQFTSLLRKGFPSVDVVEDVLYVSDGPILTSAGAAAGIDACMHLVRTVHGAEVANALARRMVVPAHREGGQAQYVEMPVPASPSGFSTVLDWAAEHLAEPLTVAVLARRAGMSGRSFARHFKAITGVTPHRWLLEQRLQRAELLLETTELTVDVVARTSGFAHPDTLRHHFARRRGTSPSAHRRAFTR
ncbi:helix-turn-helix domain-containing protein [Kibdelosporangium aridum]|uniref:Transcriptional regulator GlxA family, contains an amidase domain and an AraC-type DNA-binding HTH domain n=1 Tax=Kibdelosporangium aridum TaxID=2030 RepID=A0A1Y5XMW6_KIBAR|nr:helix-turn-helix domain-containing protein [Kibdelosporangium aridum]SMD06680.1 Transcriptional regulator GlxA family, contains an amidase domain and an AraC-type DNA-binding HTH domain [Kibdelosporangium aridum]